MVDFPNTPVDGQTHTEEGKTWVWQATPGCWYVSAAIAASVTIGDAFPVGAAVGSIHYLTVNPVGAYIRYQDSDSTQWISMDQGVSQVDGTNQFLDPAGVQSWRIVGNVLECWGTSGGNASITFLKTFKYPPTITGGDQSNLGNQRISFQNSITTTGFESTGAQAANGNGSGHIRSWHAIGEWDGIS